MKQNYIMRRALCFMAFLMGMLFVFSPVVNAQVLMNENFDYPKGELYGIGGWMKYGSNPASPIQVVDSPLTYAGYQDVATGGAIELINIANGQDLQKKFTAGDEHITSGVVYYSALINVKTAGKEADKVHFMSLINKTATGNVADGKGGSEYGKLFALAGSEGKFKLGVSRFSTNPVMGESEYELNKTYLVVVKYECVAGTTNDEVSLFVNPTDLEKEPTVPTAKYTTGSDSEVSDKNGFQSVECRQGGSSGKIAPNVIIDALRVARSYPELFGGEAPEPSPAITLSKKSLFMGSVFVGETYTQTINLKGTNLKGDVHLSGMQTGEITASAMTLSKADVESETGVDIILIAKSN